jgi:hypothetical protein
MRFVIDFVGDARRISDYFGNLLCLRWWRCQCRLVVGVSSRRELSRNVGLLSAIAFVWAYERLERRRHKAT